MRILVDTHTHTIASDHAYSTILENVAAAARAGLEGLGITDHTPPLSDSPDMMHFQNLRVVDREIDGVTVLRGAELNICDGRGNLYVDGDAMREMDYCIASIHPILYASSDPAENLRAYQGAMEDPRVKILGHPEDGAPRWTSWPWPAPPAIRACSSRSTILRCGPLPTAAIPGKT